MPSDSYTLTISDVGVSTPATGSVVNASVAANAAIAFSKLSTLNSGNILVGNSSNVAASVAVTGDVTVSNTGVTTIANDAVTSAKIANDAVTNAKIANNAVTSAEIANDAVTFSKMQNIAGYSVLGKPTSESGDVAEIESSSFMLADSTGFLRQVSATSARSTLGIVDAATGNALLSGGVGVDPAYGKVGLTTHVTGTLPAANGGTGQSSYAIGDIPFASGSTSLSKLADVATGNALLSGGVGVAPAYGKVGLTTHVTGTLPVANGGTGVTTSTGSGANALATSPTLVTPILGTPTSGTLTSCTGLPLTTGVTGTLPVANGGTGVTASTGSGSNALATSPTLVTPILGTPTSGTLTSCTGLPISTGVSGLGIGVATFLATPSSANLASAVTGETGSGALVFATSPTLVTPILGTPTSGTLTSCTGLPLTTGVTGTLPVANGGTNQVSVVRGQISRMTAFTAVTVSVIGTYYPLTNAGTLDTGVNSNMSLGAASTFSIKNTSGVTRVFRVYASVDATASNNDVLGIILFKGAAGSLAAVTETECQAFTSSSSSAAKLVTSWMISLAANEEVAVYVANHSAVANITAQRARLIAEAVL